MNFLLCVGRKPELFDIRPSGNPLTSVENPLFLAEQADLTSAFLFTSTRIA